MYNDDCVSEPSSSPQLEICNDIENFMIKKRQILITGPIDDSVSLYVNSYLQYFNQSREPVFMVINSSGGDMSAGYAIIDQMHLSGFPIFTIVKGSAHSMGAIIAVNGTKTMRYITHNSNMMLHQAEVYYPLEKIECVNRTNSFICSDYETKISDLAKLTKLSEKKLHSLLDNNLWMTPKEAISYGMVDNVWDIKMEDDFMEIYNVKKSS